jgi:hypothetical protein
MIESRCGTWLDGRPLDSRVVSARCDSEGSLRSNQSSALSRSLGVKRPKLRHDFRALALRTFDLFLLVLGDCHCDRKILVAVLTEIFVEGHIRGPFRTTNKYSVANPEFLVKCASSEAEGAEERDR